ncbi:YitT family protein [Cytobacillus sp. FJAT-54145]|uniref:YitT family protein n=1 Tax=Cytobacillus spartinae TaxID=3299023 RepID=A0ABW6KN52_9BACI
MNIFMKLILLGVAASVQGFAMAIFLFPHYIPSGGAASVSVLMNYLFKIPFSITLLILNASLLIAAVKWLGKSNALWTIYCVIVTSAIIDILSPFLVEPVSNVFVDLVIGAIIFGVGVGILFRLGASSGGMDILALIISKTRGVPPGRALFFINASVLLLTALLVDWKIIIFAIACQFISTRVLDVIYKLPIPTVITKMYKQIT